MLLKLRAEVSQRCMHACCAADKQNTKFKFKLWMKQKYTGFYNIVRLIIIGTEAILDNIL